MSDLNLISIVTICIFVLLVLSTRSVSEYIGAKRAAEGLSAAEKKAFQNIDGSIMPETRELLASTENIELRGEQMEKLIAHGQPGIQMGNLFSLYSRQIEKYQIETRSRAGTSFIFAILAMCAGLVFVFWGGARVFSGTGGQNVAAGSAISAIGGVISTYIAKTFLDVHRLSILQLNQYFKQPVLNSNILTAQRIADLIEDKSARQESYVKILDNVLSLVKNEGSTKEGK